MPQKRWMPPNLPVDQGSQQFAVYDPRGGGNAHIDQVLSNISVGWSITTQASFVGENLFPAVTVRKQSDKYWVFGQDAWQLPIGGDYRAPGTEANEITGLKQSLDTYFAVEHSLQIPVTDEERENVDAPLNPDRDGTELVTGKIVLGREVNMKTLVTDSSKYASDNVVTLSGTAQWSDQTNSDPIANVRAGFRKLHSKLFIEPNLGVIPYEVMSQLEDHPKFINRIQYVQVGVLTPELIASLLGFQKLIVPGVGYNATANPAQAASVSYLWGKDVLMAYVPPRAGLRIPAFAYEFVWGYGGSRPMVTERWREEKRKTDIIRVSRRYDLKLVTLDANNLAIGGYLIKNAVA